VPVDIRRLGHPRRDFVLVAAAGPASNLLLALAGAIYVHAMGMPTYGSSPVLHFIEANVFLAVFNLIPIPPLDGGNVLSGLLPRPAAAMFDNLRPFGFIFLYVLMFSGALGALILPPARFIWSLFGL
jgi:Zn-dependent protease